MELSQYVVVLDSRYYFSAGAGVQNRQYYFDWSVIPDGKYELTFTLVSDGAALDTALVPSIFSNMISPQNAYHASGNVGAQTHAFLGTLPLNALNASVMNFQADLTANPPVVVNRPMTNLFTIGFFDGWDEIIIS